MASTYVRREYHIEAQHDGTKHLVINNTFFRRLVTRVALYTTTKFHTRDGLCVPISKHRVVKTGCRVHLTETATMKYLAERTNVPVPKIYCSFLRKNRAHIVMESIQGDALPKVWKSLSADSLDGIFFQLKDIFQELRALRLPPGTGVGSCVGGSLYDSRIPRGNPRFGPFKTIQDFHFWFRHDFKLEDLARRDKVGIIDWEFAGWYPHYWEYTSAWFGNRTRTEWQGLLHKFLDPPCPGDFKMEDVRNKWWGNTKSQVARSASRSFIFCRGKSHRCSIFGKRKYV